MQLDFAKVGIKLRTEVGSSVIFLLSYLEHAVYQLFVRIKRKRKVPFWDVLSAGLVGEFDESFLP